MEQVIEKVLNFKKEHKILFWILIPIIGLLLALYAARNIILGYLVGQSSKDLRKAERESLVTRQEISSLNEKAEEKRKEAKSLKEDETDLNWHKK